MNLNAEEIGCGAKRHAGEYVYYPWAYDWKWEVHHGRIIDVEPNGYYIEVNKRNCSSFNSPDDRYLSLFKENELFDYSEDCQEYINHYYYDAYCNGCKYEFSEVNFRCFQCNNHDCKRKDMACGEICKDFVSNKLYTRVWHGWDEYLDTLKNCDFNKECPLHKNSCHKTCDFERYATQPIKVYLHNYDIHVNGRTVKSITVPRYVWWEGKFIKEDGFVCDTINYKLIFTKQNLIKKNQVRGLAFSTIGELKLDGNIIGDYEEYK